MGTASSSSILRKVAMALSGLFLIVFLLQHFTINVTSVFSEAVFNEFSHFMGTNALVQFVLQPVLIFGVLFHFIMGFVLEWQNRRA
ncbi:MAG: succinate dehydrogenase, partial [Flavobacteriaceae bacterium]